MRNRRSKPFLDSCLCKHSFVIGTCKELVAGGLCHIAWVESTLQSLEPKAHADRWKRIGELLEGHEDKLVVKWVKAHVTAEEVVKRKMDPKVVIGNEVADALAKRGAELARVTDQEKKNVRWYDNLAWRVHERIVYIQKHVVVTGEGEEVAEKRRKRAAERRKEKQAEDEKKAEEEKEQKESRMKANAETPQTTSLERIWSKVVENWRRRKAEEARN